MWAIMNRLGLCSNLGESKPSIACRLVITKMMTKKAFRISKTNHRPRGDMIMSPMESNKASFKDSITAKRKVVVLVKFNQLP